MLIRNINMNSLIKLIISLFVYAIENIGSHICKLLKYEPKSRCVIIYYHNVTKENQKRFKFQMNKINQICNVIDINKQIQNNDKNKSYLIISFDDAFKNIISYAIPELEKYDYPFTIFVPTGYIGKNAEWMSNQERDKNYKIMNIEELIYLSKNKNITIGSHTVHHREMDKINKYDVIRELEESKKFLERLLGTKISLLSFPYGRKNNYVLEMAKKIGYEKVYSIIPDLKRIGRDEFINGRIEVDPNDSEIEFKLKIYGCYRWLTLAFKMKKIFYTMIKRLQTG